MKKKLKEINSYFKKQEVLFEKLLLEPLKNVEIMCDIYNNLIEQKQKNLNELKEIEKREKGAKNVWIVLDNDIEDFNIKAKEYFKKRYKENQFIYIENDDNIIKNTKFLWYFILIPTARIFITKKDLINKIIKKKQVEKVVIFLIRNAKYFNQSIVSPLEIKGVNLRRTDFVFHFAFEDKLFDENINKDVMKKFEDYLLK